MITLTLPKWMVERLVQMLTNFQYTGSTEIVESILAQARPYYDSAKQ